MKQEQAKTLERKVIAEFSARRKELGYSYEKLAELTGLHRTSISLIERGKTQPTLLVCIKLASALDLKLGEVINMKA